MKKTLALILACLILCLSLAACGRNDTDNGIKTTPLITDVIPTVSPDLTTPNVSPEMTDRVDSDAANDNGNAVQGADRSSQRTATHVVTP